MSKNFILGAVAIASMLACGSEAAAQRGGRGSSGSRGGSYGGRGGEYGNYGGRGYDRGYGGYGFGGVGIGIGLGGYGGYYAPGYGYGNEYYAPAYSVVPTYGATGTPVYSTDPTIYSAQQPYIAQQPAVTVPPETVRSSLYTPDISTAPTASTTSAATIRVQVPAADARVWFDSTPMTLQGVDSLYQSPPLEQGRAYSYTIRAQWKGADGKDVEQSRTIQVRAGETATANFR